MAWIELHQAIWTHRKTFELAGLLDLEETYAAAHVLRLWCWALDNAPDGSLEGVSSRAIARGADWRGDAEAFVSALTEAGWLDEDRSIHDWQEYAGRLIDRREANAERMRAARANRVERTTPPRALHVQRTSGARAGATQPDSTQPDSTVPDRTPPVVPPAAAGGDAPKQAKASSKPAAERSDRYAQVIDLITAAEVPLSPTPRDAGAVKACRADPDQIAAAYVAAARGEWDPGGDGWLQGNLAIHTVISRIAGFLAMQQTPRRLPTPRQPRPDDHLPSTVHRVPVERV